MKYNELETSQKHHVNGVISQFMDAYIRAHLVWTPEQMYQALYDETYKNHQAGWYGSKKYVNGELVSDFYEGNKWLTSDEAKVYILKKFNDKYIKNQTLAKKKSPIIERVRFGLRRSDYFFDINYGLKDRTHDYEKTEIVENLSVIPWSINHVGEELYTKYSTVMPKIFSQLSTSPIEKIFHDEWYNRYNFNRDNPALIPELCGTRKMYYCYKDVHGRYSFQPSEDCKSVNVRFDFAVINFNKQKKLLIELDGHDYHKTKDQRLNDSIKRTIATNDGWQLNVITGSQIYRDIDEVFYMMDDYFTA